MKNAMIFATNEHDCDGLRKDDALTVCDSFTKIINETCMRIVCCKTICAFIVVSCIIAMVTGREEKYEA